MSPTVTGKILCLHGFVQSGEIFKAKSSGMRKYLKKIGLETYYLTAPIDIIPADLPFDLSENDLTKFGADTKGREFKGWWLKNDADYNIDKALEVIRECYEKEGPFIGVIGFSQGAGLAGLITQNFHNLVPGNPPLKFAIYFSGFRITDNEKLESYYDNKISIPTLHVMGELDTVVSIERAMRLPDECCETGTATILKHPGGHFVPNARNIVDKEIAWIKHVLDEDQLGPKQKELKDNGKEATTAAAEEEEDMEDILKMIDNLGKA